MGVSRVLEFTLTAPRGEDDSYEGFGLGGIVYFCPPVAILK